MKENKHEYNTKKYLLIALFLLVVSSIITVIKINEKGYYPWGENTYKYILTNNVSMAFNIFICVVFIFGGFGYILWGLYFKRYKLCLLISLIWFFIPNNLRVLFSEGNLPIVLINTLIPYFILIYYKTINEKNKFNYIGLIILISIITILNIGISIMILLILYLINLAMVLARKYVVKEFFVLGVLTTNVMLLKFTVFQYIQNHVTPKSIEYLVYPLSKSFNPFLRFENIQVFYVGLSFFILSILGILFCNNKNNERIYFVIALLIFLATSSSLLVFYSKLTIKDYLVLSRVTSFAIALVFLGIVKWINLNKLVLLSICFFVSLDSFLSFELLGFNRNLPEELLKSLDYASSVVTQKISILDLSDYGSFPYHYLYFEKGLGKEKQFTNNSINNKSIITINAALEKNYFSVLFSKSLEFGIDTLYIKKSYIHDYKNFEFWARELGYLKVYEDSQIYIYKYPINSEFIAKTTYEGISIGEYASNIIFNFPNFEIGKSTFIDDYNLQELKKYKTVLLSGFKYHNKKNAEDIVKELGESGVRVVIDTVGINYEGFLSVLPYEITHFNNYGEVYYKGENIKFEDFKNEFKGFKAKYITDSNSTDTYLKIDTMLLNYVYYYHDNIIFLGMNLPYYSYETKDKGALKILQDVLNVEPDKLPKITLLKKEGG